MLDIACNIWMITHISRAGSRSLFFSLYNFIYIFHPVHRLDSIQHLGNIQLQKYTVE